MIKKLTVTTALVAAGILTSLGYAAVAQTDRPAPSQNQSAPTQNRRPMQSQNNRQMSDLDRQFAIEAAHGGMAEVELGRLALERSRNPEVQQFAEQMIEEHTRANQELMQIASRKGITLPTTPGPKYEAAMEQMMQLSGDDFDAAYMNDAGINSHLESIGLYQRQAALGQDPDLRAFAGRILPRIQGHFQMASTMTGYSVAQGNNATPGMRMRQNNATPGMSDRQMRRNNATPGMSNGQMRQNNATPGMSDRQMRQNNATPSMDR